LRAITETCRPREDVVEGKLADFHFAAQLDQLVRNPAGYPLPDSISTSRTVVGFKPVRSSR
jgi:hypothetical protein